MSALEKVSFILIQSKYFARLHYLPSQPRLPNRVVLDKKTGNKLAPKPSNGSVYREKNKQISIPIALVENEAFSVEPDFELLFCLRLQFLPLPLLFLPLLLPFPASSSSSPSLPSAAVLSAPFDLLIMSTNKKLSETLEKSEFGSSQDSHEFIKGGSHLGTKFRTGRCESRKLGIGLLERVGPECHPSRFRCPGLGQLRFQLLDHPDDDGGMSFMMMKLSYISGYAQSGKIICCN